MLDRLRFASPLLLLVSILTALLGTILFVGGIILAFADRSALTSFTLFDNDFSSTSVGVVISFMGVVFVALVLRRVLKLVDHAVSSGGTGGAAEVVGDGEARGGRGGKSGKFGPGGDGGSTRVRGTGKAEGGAGGDG